jgi:UDP-N-acetylglucosamine transferase subunit ALG13
LSTFVSIGNLKKPFARLLQAVSDNADLLPRPVLVQHGHTPFDDPNFEAVSFLGMEEFQQRVAEATLIVLHGGAGSIITALQAGRRPIVMARRASLDEHVDDHQLELVRELSGAGRILVAEDAGSLRAMVSQALSTPSVSRMEASASRTKLEELVGAELADWESKLKEHR